MHVHQLESGSTKPKLVRGTALPGARRKVFTEKTLKQSKAIIWLVMASVVALFGKV